ncbi:hypothetical protein ON010_g13289 [Phytophthora cinnamomi]|nr:hypothetical protein ON010_g13289 [Phytophthora cinnamomi]
MWLAPHPGVWDKLPSKLQSRLPKADLLIPWFLRVSHWPKPVSARFLPMRSVSAHELRKCVLGLIRPTPREARDTSSTSRGGDHGELDVQEDQAPLRQQPRAREVHAAHGVRSRVTRRRTLRPKRLIPVCLVMQPVPELSVGAQGGASTRRGAQDCPALPRSRGEGGVLLARVPDLLHGEDSERGREQDPPVS